MNEPLWPFLFLLETRYPRDRADQMALPKKCCDLFVCHLSNGDPSFFPSSRPIIYGNVLHVYFILALFFHLISSGNNWFQLAPTGPNWPKLLLNHPRASVYSAAKPVRNFFYFSKVEGHLQRIPENLTIGQKVFFYFPFSLSCFQGSGGGGGRY